MPQGAGFSVIVINPNNAQDIRLNSTNATGRSAHTRFVDLLHRLHSRPDDEPELITAVEDGFDAAGSGSSIAGADIGAVPYIVPQAVNYGDEDVRDDVIGDEELAGLLQRQTTRGLSPKQLLSFLVQDKRRRRLQEAGFYLRNYDLNRK